MHKEAVGKPTGERHKVLKRAERRSTPEDYDIVKSLYFETTHSLTDIALKLGLTRNQVASIIYNRGAEDGPKREIGKGDWDSQLREPWSEYHARKKAERAAALTKDRK